MHCVSHSLAVLLLATSEMLPEVSVALSGSWLALELSPGVLAEPEVVVVVAASSAVSAGLETSVVSSVVDGG